MKKSRYARPFPFGNAEGTYFTKAIIGAILSRIAFSHAKERRGVSSETGEQLMSLSLFREKNITIAVLMTTAIFMVDLFAPLWYDVWVLYLIPLFFMYQSAKRPYVYSAIVTLLIAAGLLVSPSDSTSLMHASANRVTGISGGWAVSFLLMQLKRLQVSLLKARTELEKRVEDRTAELSQANRSLQEDIAERKKMEQALRASEERYRLLFHKTPIGIFNYDTQLILTAWNDRFVEILRSSREKLLGLDMNTLKDQSVIPAIRKALEGDEGHYEGPYRATTSPAEIWVSMRTAPIFDQDGKVSNGVGIVEDVTERKQAEEEKGKLIFELQNALTKVKQLSGLLPICASCKKIRDDKGYWNQIEVYIRDHSEAEFTHGICPECQEKALKAIDRFKKSLKRE